MINELLWKMVTVLPPTGETISHLKLIEIMRDDLLAELREKYCPHEMPESLDSEMIDQIKCLEDRLSPEVKLEIRAGIYHLGWSEPAANMPSMRDEATSGRCSNSLFF
jgi:hypothetical protein